MDSIFAIAIGLGIRLLVDFVSQHDFRVGGSLVGLWEGVVLYHFLDKMPKSFDPYVAYGFRLFVDFLFTESLYRMALVMLWTGLGMVLSDIAPVFWHDTGLRHVSRRLRRDVELFALPAIPFFHSKTSTSSRVRFRSPSRASSVVTSVRSIGSSTSSSTLTPTNLTPQSTPVIAPVVISTRRKTRIVPGSFPDDWSETDADSVLDRPPSEQSEDGSQTPTHELPPVLESDESDDESDHRLTGTPDEDDLTSESSSDSVDPSEKDPLEIPEEDEGPFPDEKCDQDRTPTASSRMIPLPPTPADSEVDLHEVHEVQPPLSALPLIPDSPFVRDSFNAGGEDQEPLPIPPVKPPITDDISNYPAPPPAYYSERLDNANAGSTTTTPPNDAAINDEPPPIINVEPPGPDDNEPPGDDLAPASEAPPSQTSGQPQLGSDLSPKFDTQSIADTERPISELSENPGVRLEQALAFRREANRIRKKILHVKGERKQALNEKNSAVALLKSQERERLEKEEKEMNRKAERRIFTAHNASSSPGTITVAGLEAAEAVSRIEAALAALLVEQGQSSDANSGAELRVALGSAKVAKLNGLRVGVREAMKEHQIIVTDGPDSNTLILTIPKIE